MLVNRRHHGDTLYSPCVTRWTKKRKKRRRDAENVDESMGVGTHPSIDMFATTRGWTSQLVV